MIRKVAYAAAWLALMISPDAARALPEEPLSSAPLIYDAENKLIGPMFLGQTYITIDGRYYSLLVEKNRVGAIYARMSFKDDACKEEAYIEGRRLDFVPEVIGYDKKIYLPYRSAEVVETRSYRYVNNFGGSDRCNTYTETKKKIPLKEKLEKSLGITFPVRLERPQ